MVSRTIALVAVPGIGEDVPMPGPLTRVQVVGPSMEPYMRNGDWWVVRRTTRDSVRRTARLRVGDVVVLVHPGRPDALIVKRLDHRDGDSWWVVGDNPEVSEDSRHFGSVPESAIVGRPILRYHRLRRQ
jgi:nickel-type superoxide dismutase maturation protease